MIFKLEGVLVSLNVEINQFINHYHKCNSLSSKFTYFIFIFIKFIISPSIKFTWNDFKNIDLTNN